ncbi:Phosphoribosylaminoimidazole-succinocarboxamide synthase [Frankliniella fusca]|uniref:Phosphoribosylaminoimidazole-succinocarboxamide synthase n=1 Tax=Frankliniella fusca TaxID=407009 RepID=A0AAE1H9P8_9NEOP|nr:Phosphoribosylaminoimidazole-succinocarboxamide synthase [Frankliniella fusca]
MERIKFRMGPEPAAWVRYGSGYERPPPDRTGVLPHLHLPPAARAGTPTPTPGARLRSTPRDAAAAPSVVMLSNGVTSRAYHRPQPAPRLYEEDSGDEDEDSTDEYGSCSEAPLYENVLDDDEDDDDEPDEQGGVYENVVFEPPAYSNLVRGEEDPDEGQVYANVNLGLSEQPTYDVPTRRPGPQPQQPQEYANLPNGAGSVSTAPPPPPSSGAHEWRCYDERLSGAPTGAALPAGLVECVARPAGTALQGKQILYDGQVQLVGRATAEPFYGCSPVIELLVSLTSCAEQAPLGRQANSYHYR